MHKDPPIPFQDIFQGNGSGPNIWVSVSEPLIEIMQLSGRGIKFEVPLSRYKDRIVGFAFVDDTGILEGNLTKTEITIGDVYISMQKYINIW